MANKRKPGRPRKKQEAVTPEPQENVTPALHEDAAPDPSDVTLEPQPPKKKCDLATLGMREIRYMKQQMVDIVREGFAPGKELRPVPMVRQDRQSNLNLEEAQSLEAALGRHEWVLNPGKGLMITYADDGTTKRRLMISPEVHEQLRND